MILVVQRLLVFIILLGLNGSVVALEGQNGLIERVRLSQIDASFLYWKMGGDELDYVYDLSNYQSSQGVALYKKRFHQVSSHYAPGFRFNLSFDLPCICWESTLIWTHFDSQNTSRKCLGYRSGINTEAAISFFRDSQNQLAMGQKAALRGSLNFKLDLIDLEFGKWLNCNDCLQFRPFIGLRAAHVKEKFHSEVDFYSNVSQGVQVDRKARIYNEFKGAGLLAGLDTELSLSGQWSLIGSVGASLVWGYTKVRNQFTQYNQVLLSEIDYKSNESEHFRHSRVITDLSLGLRYRTVFCSCPLGLILAWEHHYLFNQHRFFASDIAFSGEGYNYKKMGGISLQGLTATAEMEF